MHLQWKIELVPLVMNIGITIAYLIKGDEPAKVWYWGGAVIMTIGLYMMKG